MVTSATPRADYTYYTFANATVQDTTADATVQDTTVVEGDTGEGTGADGQGTEDRPVHGARPVA